MKTLESESLSIANLVATCQGNDKQLPSYKVYVGKGNNSMLIRTLFKLRYWWLLQDKWENTNMAWTQCRKQEIFNTFKTKFQIEKKEPKKAKGKNKA